jgi:putative membrane protein
MSEQYADGEKRTGSPLHACHAGGPASVVVLVALGSLLLAKWRDGALPLYVHPSYAPFLALTGVALLGLGVVQLWGLAHRALRGPHDAAGASGFTWALGLVMLAVVVGALLPARPLGSTAAASQSTGAPPQALQPLTDETEGWTLLEWAQAVGGGVQRERLVGRPVSVVGFVYRPREGPGAGDTRVARFVVRCCAADGFAVSLPIRSPVADALQPDTWVHVEGVLRIDESGVRPTAYVEADRLTIVPAPAVPYLIPT